MSASWSLRCRSHPSLPLGLLTLLFGAAALLLPPRVAAQEKDYEKWLRQQRQEYKQFLNEQDKAFLKFLKKEWTSVRVDTTAASPIDDKPRQIPRVEDVPPETPDEEPFETEPPRDDAPQTSPPSPDRPSEGEDAAPKTDPFAEENESEPSPTPEVNDNPTEDRPPAPDRRPAEPAPEEGGSSSAALNREASLSFFGASATVPYGSASVPRLEGTPGKSSIRRFWKTMAKGPYRPTLDVLQKQREDLGLSDWGYYLYLNKLSAQLYGDGASNERTLWTWFMMMKSGYAARVGYRGAEVLLMLPVDQKIFGRPQMHLGGQRYYLMVESMNGSLRTYEGQHEGARRALQLDEGTLPDVASESETRTVEFSFQDQRHSLDIAYNPATVEYLRAYPNVGLPVLLGAGVSSAARSSFEDTLQSLLADRSPRASLNLLLTFAQFATDYKRDQDHFGEERYLFPEESLASDYSDCEDRAVLLAYLVRTLLGRQVVGLQWPNHVALAVRAGNGLEAENSDRTISVDGSTYVFADPTYIGSSLGMEMPIIEGQEPEVISPGP